MCGSLNYNRSGQCLDLDTYWGWSHGKIQRVFNSVQEVLYKACPEKATGWHESGLHWDTTLGEAKHGKICHHYSFSISLDILSIIKSSLAALLLQWPPLYHEYIRDYDYWTKITSGSWHFVSCVLSLVIIFIDLVHTELVGYFYLSPNVSIQMCPKKLSTPDPRNNVQTRWKKGLKWFFRCFGQGTPPLATDVGPRRTYTPKKWPCQV